MRHLSRPHAQRGEGGRWITLCFYDVILDTQYKHRIRIAWYRMAYSEVRASGGSVSGVRLQPIPEQGTSFRRAPVTGSYWNCHKTKTKQSGTLICGVFPTKAQLQRK